MNYWNERLKIGSLNLPRFIGGPLDGITDSPFRKLVREFSQDELLYSEMRHVASVSNERGGQLALNFDPAERPISFQIAANSERFIAQACEKINAKGVDLIDLNAGCPARNVVNNCGGSALMADPVKFKSILATLQAHAQVPFTVKIRAGFKEKNAVDIAKLVEDSGASALAIHPRLQTQAFAGQPDYALAAQVKKAVSIPVLLSGNVINWKTAQLAYDQTGVDGFLIGRGIWGKPWKLFEMQQQSQGKPFFIDQVSMLHYAIKHLDLMLAHYGQHGLFCFRKHIPFYLKGISQATSLREKLVRVTSEAEMKQMLLAIQSECAREVL